MEAQVTVYGLDCTLNVRKDHDTGIYASERRDLIYVSLLEVKHEGRNIDHLFHKNTLDDLAVKNSMDLPLSAAERIVYENWLAWDKLEEAAIEEYFKN
jgi:hypothetical protein